MSDITIYHNPNCGTSRNTLALLRERGLEPKVVEYLKVGWSEPQLKDLLKRLGVPARAILRLRGTHAEALGLTDPSASDQTLIAAMVREPILVERPIVVTPKSAALCRPAQAVLALI